MPVNAAERDALLARYRGGFAAFAAAMDEIGDRLDEAADGGWTARQVAHHLADSEMTAAIRLRRVLAEDGAFLAAYDEKAFAERLHYERPVESSLRAAEAARGSSAALLEALGEDEWARVGTHEESGPYGVEHWLRIYADHPYDHAEQARRAARIDMP